MAVSFRASTEDARGTGGTSCDPGLPAGTVEGDLLICVHTCDLNGSLTGLVAPTGWTQLGTGTSRSDVGFMQPVRHQAGSGQPHGTAGDTSNR